MTKDTEQKDGSDFAELTSSLETRIIKLCEATYKATKRPPTVDQTKALIHNADGQIAEYEELLKIYSGARRESIVNAGTQITALKRFVTTLRELVKE